MDKNSVLIARKIEEACARIASISPDARIDVLENALARLFAENELIERYLASPKDFLKENRRSFLTRCLARLKNCPTVCPSNPKALFSQALWNYALITALKNNEEFDLRAYEERLLEKTYKNLLAFPLA